MMTLKLKPFSRRDSAQPSTRLTRHVDRRALRKQARQAAREERRAARDLRMKKREALTWFRHGAPLVPLIAGGKKPIFKGGVHAPLTQREDVIAFFDKRPRANYGIATGRVSGLVVIDVDGPEGEASLRALEATYGPLPTTTVVRTPRGRHIYLRSKGKRIPSRAGKLGLGLDVRGDGGYVVGVSSTHPSGSNISGRTILPL